MDKHHQDLVHKLFAASQELIAHELKFQKMNCQDALDQLKNNQSRLRLTIEYSPVSSVTVDLIDEVDGEINGHLFSIWNSPNAELVS